MGESSESPKVDPELIAPNKVDGLEAIKTGFSASGWLMMYQFGVAGAMQDAGVQHKGHFVGSSGGSLVAGCLALDVDIEFVRDFILKCCVHCRSSPLRNAFRLREYVLCCIRKATDGAMHRSKAVEEKRLHVSVTLLPSFKNVLLSEFGTNEEVIESLLASCCMSPLAGMPFRLGRTDELDGTWIFDGGLTFMHPHLGEEETVSVSAFYFSKAEIRPSQFVPLHWALFPPTVSEMEKLYWLGHHDASVFLASRRERLRPEKPLAATPATGSAWRNGVGLGKNFKMSPTDKKNWKSKKAHSDEEDHPSSYSHTRNSHTRARGRSRSSSSSSVSLDSGVHGVSSRRNTRGGGSSPPLSELLRPHVDEEFELSRLIDTDAESAGSETSQTIDDMRTTTTTTTTTTANMLRSGGTDESKFKPKETSFFSSVADTAAKTAAAAADAAAATAGAAAAVMVTSTEATYGFVSGMRHRNANMIDDEGAAQDRTAEANEAKTVPPLQPIRRVKTMPGPLPLNRSWAQRLSMKALSKEIEAIELSSRRTRSLSADSADLGVPLDAESYERMLMANRHRRDSLSIRNAKQHMFKWFHQFLDIWFVLAWWMFRVVVRPFAYYLMYTELFSRAFFSATRAVVVGLEKGRRTLIGPGRGPMSLRDMLPSQVLGSARAALHEGVDHLKSALDPRLFMSSLPLIGKWFVAEDVVEKVQGQSVVFRVFKHTRVYNNSS